MENHNAMMTRAHVHILKLRVESLQCELKISTDQSEQLDQELNLAQSRLRSIREDFNERKEELVARYNHEFVEYNKQIRLAEEVLTKKRDERQAMLDYLKEKNLCVTSCLELKDFDWDTLKRVLQGRDKSEIIIEQEESAQKLSELNLKARSRLQDLSRLIASTAKLKDVRNRTYNYLKEHVDEWKTINQDQEKKIARLQGENERLTLLIKQCAASNEPMSDYVTQKVRAKCHSFLNSEDENELILGLTKFKQRQDRMIKLLKHKENKLSRDINQLVVAKDQTHDQMLYYTNIITVNKDLNLAADMVAQREPHHLEVNNFDNFE